jgi:signal transduction histidine kinase
VTLVVWPHRGEKGTGIGLAIVGEIVLAHGWEVTVTDGTHDGVGFEIAGVDVLD